MAKTKSKYLGSIFIFFILIGYGCSMTPQYGKYALLTPKDITNEQLYKNWENYNVYYAGVSIGGVNAILFDPKDDDRKIEVHKWWVEVKDHKLLSELMGFIYLEPGYYPNLKAILGPDNQIYGYLFSVWWNVPIKVVDKNTLWIDDLSTIPQLKLYSSELGLGR